MRETALVTGGAGFIGSHLVEALLKRNWRVRVLDDFSSGSRDNLAGLGVEIVEGDVRDPDTCAGCCRGVDSVFHLAAMVSVPGSVADPVTSHAVNVTGVMNMLMAARDQNVRRFVLSSSASVYGNSGAVPTPETAPLDPESPYATAKASAELYCRNFWKLYRLETVALRYFNVFGPRQSPGSPYAAVIPLFIAAVLEGRQPRIFGDGLQTRDFTHVRNVVQANLLAAERPGVAGEVFNVACGEEVPLREVLTRVEQLLECRIEPEYLPGRAGDVKRSCADISAAIERLHYRPVVGFAEGLAETVGYLLGHPSPGTELEARLPAGVS